MLFQLPRTEKTINMSQMNDGQKVCLWNWVIMKVDNGLWRGSFRRLKLQLHSILSNKWVKCLPRKKTAACFTALSVCRGRSGVLACAHPGLAAGHLGSVWAFLLKIHGNLSKMPALFLLSERKGLGLGLDFCKGAFVISMKQLGKRLALHASQ